MSLEIRMPQVSSDMTEADVVGWLVEPGDRVREGDLIYELETDKSTVEIEAPASGVLREIRVPAGSTGIAVGTVLAILDEAVADARGESKADGARPGGDPPEPVPPPGPSAPEPAEPAADTAGAKPAERSEAAPKPGAAEVPATALARRVAERAGVDLSRIAGSGARGRVTRDDVEQQLAEASGRRPATGPRAGARAGEASPAPRQGAGPAEARQRSAPDAACLTARCGIDAALSVLARLNADVPEDRAIRLIDLVVRAAALALEEIPDANFAWGGDAAIVLERADVGISLGTDRGETSGVIRDASAKGLAAVSAERRALVDQGDSSETDSARATEIGLEIADFGAFGLVAAVPSAPSARGHVLGVGAPQSEPVVRDGQAVGGTTLTLTLRTNPHAGGAFVAARLLAAIARRLERPLEMIV